MFSKIYAENIFSWEKLEFDVEQGITLIDGFNYDDGVPEGSGKSSIPNILCWTLFGKIPKEVKIDDVIRDGANSCIGAVYLSNGYVVIRQRKPNTLSLIDDEGNTINGKDAKETQALIEKHLGFTFETFCQSVYFAQNYPKRFITADETEKSKILSELQDLEIFDRAKKTITAKLSTLNKILDKSTNLVELQEVILEGKVNLLKEKTEAIKGLTGGLDELPQVEASISELEKDLTTFNDAVESIDKEESDLKAREAKNQMIDNNIRMYDRSFHQNEMTLGKTQKELNDLMEAIKNAICPLCEGKLTKEHSVKTEEKRKALEATMDELLTKRNEFVLERKNLEDGRSNMTEVHARMFELSSDKKAIREAKSNLDKQLQDLRHFKSNFAEIEKKKDEVKVLKLEIVQTEKAINENATIRDNASKEIIELDILGDSMKQVKSYVFRNLLDEISQKATDFALKLFEVPVSITFFNEGDDGEASKIKVNVTYDGTERSLGLLSGGQARRVQLAVDLALAQIIGTRANNPISFRIFDEITKDLSEPSMEKVLSLLKELNGTTLLIEHNSMAKALVDNVYFVELRNRISNANT